MCRLGVTKWANAIAIATATPWLKTLPSGSSRSEAIAGSPMKPMPREAIVMPSWHADRYSSMRSISCSASAAPFWPSSRICSTRLPRARTSANSAATKKPFRATSTATPRRRSSSVTSGREPGTAGYFEAVRRRSSADAASVAGGRRAILVSMRIASLVPSATEMLFALDLGDSVVAVTHECDYPPRAQQLAHLTRSVIPDGLPPAEIDAAVRERTSRGEALYELDEEKLRELEVDLIVTQAVCEVCAVSFDDVRAVAERLPTRPRVISLDPSTLGEVLADIPRLAQAAGAEAAGDRLAEEAGRRIEAVEQAVEGTPRPRVAALEWLDPVYVGGHWVPQMVELAGGEDVLGRPGERSRTAQWAEVEATAPEIVVAMPCGYYAEQAVAEAVRQRDRLGALEARVVAVDAAAYFSRPGPRLVEGIELFGHLLHPDLVPAPPTRRSIEVDLERPSPVAT